MRKTILTRGSDTLPQPADDGAPVRPVRRFFVSRHAGAIAWARSQPALADVVFIAHLNPEHVVAGDIVMGTLPVNLAYEVCRRGARYYHLSLRVAAAQRGQELTRIELEVAGACLEPYEVVRRGSATAGKG